MEDWMHYERVRRDLFQQPGAYAFPFGSTRLGWLYEASDAELRRLSLPRAAPGGRQGGVRTTQAPACPADAHQRRGSRGRQWRGGAIGYGQEVSRPTPYRAGG